MGGGRRGGSAALEHELAVLAVQRPPHRLGQHVGNGSPVKLVPERDRVRCRHQDPRLQCLLHLGQQRGGGQAEHVGHIVQRECPVQYGHGLQQMAGPWAQPVEPGPYGRPDPCGQIGGGQLGVAFEYAHALLVFEPFEQFDDHERIARGSLDQAQQSRIRRRGEPVGRQRGDGVVRERVKFDPGSAILLQEGEQPVRVVPVFCAAPGEDPQHRIGGQLPRQRPHGQQRRRIGPVQIVQAHQDWIGGRPLLQLRPQLGDQLHPLVRHSDECTRAAGRPIVLRARGQQGAQRHQLAEFVCRVRGDGEVALGRGTDRLGEQQRFADAVSAFDQKDATPAGLGMADRAEDGRPLASASAHAGTPGGVPSPSPALCHVNTGSSAMTSQLLAMCNQWAPGGSCRAGST